MTMFPITNLTHSSVDLAHFKLNDLWWSTYSEKTGKCTETSSAILQDGDAHAEGAPAPSSACFKEYFVDRMRRQNLHGAPSGSLRNVEMLVEWFLQSVTTVDYICVCERRVSTHPRVFGIQ